MSKTKISKVFAEIARAFNPEYRADGLINSFRVGNYCLSLRVLTTNGQSLHKEITDNATPCKFPKTLESYSKIANDLGFKQINPTAFGYAEGTELPVSTYLEKDGFYFMLYILELNENAMELGVQREKAVIEELRVILPPGDHFVTASVPEFDEHSDEVMVLCDILINGEIYVPVTMRASGRARLDYGVSERNIFKHEELSKRATDADRRDRDNGYEVFVMYAFYGADFNELDRCLVKEHNGVFVSRPRIHFPSFNR